MGHNIYQYYIYYKDLDAIVNLNISLSCVNNFTYNNTIKECNKTFCELEIAIKELHGSMSGHIDF